MKKNLPKVFKNTIDKKINNNKTFAYGDNNKKKEIDINNFFKQNTIYRKEVKITLENEVVKKKIIGRSLDRLITIDNELIKIDDIKKIEEV